MAKKQSRFVKQQKRFLMVGAAIVLAVLGYVFTLVVKDSIVSGDFVEGEHYQSVEKPRRIHSDKIEVMEFFSYGCIHCYRFDPMLSQWVEENGDKVNFVRSPLVASEGWMRFGRHYYTMEKLGLAEQYHMPFFREVQDRKLNVSNPERLAGWARDNDIEDYLDVYDSGEVRHKVALADQLSRRVQVASVPTLLIHGKYIVRTTESIGSSRMLDVADFLVAKELSAATTR